LKSFLLTVVGSDIHIRLPASATPSAPLRENSPDVFFFVKPVAHFALAAGKYYQRERCTDEPQEPHGVRDCGGAGAPIRTAIPIWTPFRHRSSSVLKCWRMAHRPSMVRTQSLA